MPQMQGGLGLSYQMPGGQCQQSECLELGLYNLDARFLVQAQGAVRARLADLVYCHHPTSKDATTGVWSGLVCIGRRRSLVAWR